MEEKEVDVMNDKTITNLKNNRLPIASQGFKEIENQIDGLYLLEDFLTEKEEEELMLEIDACNNWETRLKRRVMHFGQRFDYFTRKIDETNLFESSSSSSFPSFLLRIVEKMQNNNHIKLETIPNQCTINEYLIGQGIAPHVDTHSPFHNQIISISLGSGTTMVLKNVLNEQLVYHLYIPARSLLLLSNEARFGYSHGIPSRKSDYIQQQTVIRSKRVSLTFRTVKENPFCNCEYFNACDYQNVASLKPVLRIPPLR